MLLATRGELAQTALDFFCRDGLRKAQLAQKMGAKRAGNATAGDFLTKNYFMLLPFRNILAIVNLEEHVSFTKFFDTVLFLK